MNVNGKTDSTGLWPAMGAAQPPAPPRNRPSNNAPPPQDVLGGLGGAVNKLRGAGSDGVDRKALEQGLGKMSAALNALAGADGLDSAMAQIMREQSKQSDNACKRAEEGIKNNYDKMKQQTIRKRKAAAERHKAEKKKSGWQKFVSFFKKVVDFCVAAVGMASGNPVAVAASVLKLSSLAVGEMAQNTKFGRWAKFGLSVAGGAVGCLTSGPQDVAPKIGEAANATVEGVGHYVKGEADEDIWHANADIQDVKAERQQALNALEQEKETIKSYVESQTDGVRLVTKILNSRNRVAKKAAG